jgi:undecaprenyl-diphosphatase
MTENAHGKEWSNLSIVVIIGSLLVGMIACIVFVDAPVFSWLRQNHDLLPADGLIKAIELLGKVYPIIWLLLFWVFFTGRHKRALVCFLAMLITLPAVVSIKEATRRQRPREVIKAQASIENKSKPANNWSFPSGDTASVFAAGTVLTFSAPWPLVIGAAICCGTVGVLRVTELAHYPSDVFAGAALGVLCGWAAIKILNKRPQIENIPALKLQVISIIGIFLIPALIWFFQGTDKLIILLKYYGPATAIVFVAGRVWKSKQNRV